MEFTEISQGPDTVFTEASVNLAVYASPKIRISAKDIGKLFVCAAQITNRWNITLLVIDGSCSDSLGWSTK